MLSTPLQMGLQSFQIAQPVDGRMFPIRNLGRPVGSVQSTSTHKVKLLTTSVFYLELKETVAAERPFGVAGSRARK